MVTAAPPVVDVTSAVVAEDITLDLTEAVPTGRSYQSYLQLVPGVLPDDPESPGPASKSGLNYRDVGGDAGVSRDNFYYIDGINVTDGVSGTFGANLNTEIIQEQQVLTGGIPAEYVGAPGLLSSVITKSGTNRLSGSVNYFFQNDGLVAENRNASDQEFSRFDTALTGGGPIVTDEAWSFGSYRRVGRNDTVVALDGIDVIRTVEEAQDQFYARGTWAPSTNNTIGFTFLNDPTEVSGSRDRDVTNARDSSRVQGGNNYHLKYTRLFGDLLVEGRTAGTMARCRTTRRWRVRGTASSSATPTSGRSKTSSSAASGSTTSTSATPRATRAPRSCRPAGTPSTAA